VAGATRPLFSQGAIAQLHAAAAGVPRVLNQLATQALLEGMARGASQVDDGIVETVAAERDFAGPVGARG
jgi:general secretion pathway protein A